MRLTEEQYALLLRRNMPEVPPRTKPSKYHNVRAESADGKHFDSKLERDYYERLLLLWEAGEVRWFIRQVPFELEGGVVFRADFLVVTKEGDVQVVDTTGLMTQVKANKLKQVKARYGIDVQIVRHV